MPKHPGSSTIHSPISQTGKTFLLTEIFPALLAAKKEFSVSRYVVIDTNDFNRKDGVRSAVP
jgi:hypothetical protein